MKNIFNHLINSRMLTSFQPGTNELLRNTNRNYLFDLSYLSVLDVTGDKAQDFLQGQLTCNLNLVSDIQMIQGAQCNLKGRIVSLLDIINWNGFKLVLPKDLLEPTINSLAKTAQLSRVAIQENKDFKLFGLYLQNSDDITPDSAFLPASEYALAYSSHYCYYHLGNGFYVFIVPTEFAAGFCKPFSEKDQLLGSLAWHTLGLENKRLNIYPESRGLFLPHRLDLHQTQYLSFDKGCYKGQEIIARMHYKATIKHELQIYTVHTEGKIYSGQKLFDINNEGEVGELVDYSLLGDNDYLIAVSILKTALPCVHFEGHAELVEIKK